MSLTGANKGSVGQTTTLYGKDLKSVFGYQDNIVRTMKKKFKTFTKRSKDGLTTENSNSLVPSAADAASIETKKIVVAMENGFRYSQSAREFSLTELCSDVFLHMFTIEG